MKILLMAAIVCSAFVNTSCSSNTSSPGNTASTDAVSHTTSASGDGNVIFSYNLDGEKISGGETDEMQINNTGWIAQSKLQFFLNDTYNDKKDLFAHSLRFAIPDKTGTTTFGEEDDKWRIELFLGTGEDGKYVLYGNEAFTVTVADISPSRISGSFSGKLKLSETTGTGKTEYTVTDGKFDIPVRKEK